MAGFFISWEDGGYYEGDKVFWKDMDLPSSRPGPTWVWDYGPDRPTRDDWQFDGHDADGGQWVNTEPEAT